MSNPHRLLFGTLLTLTACQAGDAADQGLTFDDAAQIVRDQILVGDEKVIVFGHDEPVDETNTLQPYALPGMDPGAAIEIGDESWLFMIDDAPLAQFSHPTRFVLVDRMTGEVEVSTQNWWPVLDGVSLFTDGYEELEGAVYPEFSEVPRAGEVPDGGGDEQAPCVGNGAALVVNAWGSGETGREDFDADGQRVDDVLTRGGLDTTYLAPAGSAGADGVASNEAVRSYLATKATELKAGDTLVVYVTGHGAALPSGTAFIGEYPEITLADALGAFDPGVNIIFVADSCKSGAFIDGMQKVADVTITSTSDDLLAYGDLDGDAIEEFFFGAASDPNPDDVGGEFTSGLVAGLNALLNATDVARLEQKAQAESTSFWEEAFLAAFPQALKNDVAFLTGKSRPQRAIGNPETTHGSAAPADGPVCPPPPDDTPDPDPTDPDPDPTNQACPELLTDLEQIARRMAAVPDLPDSVPQIRTELCDDAYEDDEEEEVEHSDGEQSRRASGPTDSRYYGAARGCYEESGLGGCGHGEPLAARPIDLLQCGPDTDPLAVCPAAGFAPATGDFVLFYDVLDANIEPEAGNQLYEYAVVVDRDGDESNDYQASPAFPNDYFAGTDRWYVASWNSVLGWRLYVSDIVDGAEVQVPSGARVIIEGNTIAFIVPRSELGSDPSYRVTSFRHDGDYGVEGDWNGDIDPLVGEPLLPLP